jgi:hypothetical protein
MPSTAEKPVTAGPPATEEPPATEGPPAAACSKGTAETPKTTWLHQERQQEQRYQQQATIKKLKNASNRRMLASVERLFIERGQSYLSRLPKY